MGYLGRRIGKSADTGNPTADGTGAGLLDLFTNGYFQRQGNIYNAPGLGPLSGLTATGGVISDYTVGPAVYRAHIFTSSSTFEVTELGNFGDTVEYLVVAGGGAGGAHYGGGGGAGGLRTNLSGHPLAGSPFPITVSPYPVIIGSGGASSAGAPAPRGQNGNTSSFGSISCDGGGAGGANGGVESGAPGGSGGGEKTGGFGSGNSPTPYSPPQGNPGGADDGTGGQCGGGGGAGGAGGNAPPTVSGVGGAGVQVAIAGPAADTTGVGALNPGPGEYQWFAGGGAGGGIGAAGQAGGVGGGGWSYPNPTPNGQYATGGGGGGRSAPGAFQGNGGSGIVVVRYQIAQLTATAKASGGAITAYAPTSPSPMAGKTVHVFTTSGTFTAPTPLNPTPLAVEYLVVGGGGGGGGGLWAPADGHAAGGAGGLRTNHPDCPAPLRSASYSVSPGSPYTVTVGAGGQGGHDGPVTIGQNGSNSEFYPTPVSFPSGLRIRGAGGGGGGGSNVASPGDRFGKPGGSGGGGNGGGPPSPNAGDGNLPADPNWPIAQGNPGGNTGPDFGSGGGGGFISAGTSADASNNPGPGGAGVDLGITGITTGYAGGGGGGAAGPYRGTYSGGTATHGGGAGADADTTAPTYFGGDGTMSTGGGGGGGGGNHPTSPIPGITAGSSQHFGGNGGSGIVVIAYPS